MAPYCTAGKVHVGLDESFHLGQCPRCREEVARVGLGGHFAGHVNRLHQLAARHNLQLGMWADMLYFVPDAIPQLPRGITAYDWYYYPFSHKPRVEFFNFAERDLFPALHKQGIHYYGCPMNGAFRYEPLPIFGDRLANIRSWWQRCGALKADGMLVTSWEAYRLALETTTAVDAAAASLWLEPDHDDATAMLARGLERVFGSEAARAQARGLLAADEHAFSGYARWQINDRWDVFAGTESLKPYANEVRFFERLQSAGSGWPVPFAASIAFRLYLAQRDVFVRQAARDVFKCRKLPPDALRAQLRQMQAGATRFGRQLKAGQRAARAMWQRTRDRGAPSQNAALLAQDLARLEAWRGWLKAAAKNPAILNAATPVCGAWQLQFMVHNLTPAVAKVIVEEQDEGGQWREIAGRYTIEFRAAAARPATRIKREFTVPVPSRESALRLSIHGVGQAGISHAALADGRTRLVDARFRSIVLLGEKAPRQGLPDPRRRSKPLTLIFR
jgi:hypothetical protein